MNRRNKILLLSAVATFDVVLPWGSAGIAADNTVILSPGTGVTMRSKDIGAGVQSPVNILGDLAGNPLYITNANSGVANGSTNVPTVSYNFGFNGTSWDQLQVDGAKFLKVTQGGSLWTVGGTVTANQGSPPWLMTGTVQVGNFPALQTVGGTVVANQGGAPWTVTGTVSTSPTGTQAVSGTLGATQATTPWTVTGTVTQGGAPWTMTGTVQVGNFPALQTVGGTVVANQGGSPWTITGTVSQNATWNFNCLSGCGGSVTVGNVGIATWANGTLGPMSTFGGTVGSILVPSFNSWVVGGTLAASQVGVWSFNCNSGCGGSVSVGNVGINTWANGTLGPMSVFGGTVGSILVPSFNAWLVGGTVTAIAAGNQLVSGTVNVGNFPAIQTVSGTVTQGGAPWVVTGTVTQSNFPANQLVSGTLGVTQGGAPWTVSGTVQVGNFPAIQTVGGTVTANQGGAPWTVAGTVTALPSGTQVVSGTLGVTQAGAPWLMSGTVTVGNFPTTQTVGGTVTALQGGGAWAVTGTFSAAGGTLSNGNLAFGTTSANQGSISFNYGYNGSASVWNPVRVDALGNMNVNVQSALGVANGTIGSLTGSIIMGQVQGSATALANTSFNYLSQDIWGSVRVAPYAAGNNMMHGTLTTSGTAPVQLIAAPGAGLYIYATDLACYVSGSTSAGTEVQFLNGSAGSPIYDAYVPPGGGAFAATFPVPKGGIAQMTVNGPLFVKAVSSTTLICNAGGYKGL